MTEGQFDLKITRYRTPKDKPTCAIDFKNGKVCVFLQTYKLGTCETCFFIPDDTRRKMILERGILPTDCYLIPFDECPIWKDREVMPLQQDEILERFRRYLRACQSVPYGGWEESAMNEWANDRDFLETEYQKKRHIDFNEASNYAHEQLYLRCMKMNGEDI